MFFLFFFFFSSRRRHTRSDRDWSSDVCSSDLLLVILNAAPRRGPKLLLSARKRLLGYPTEFAVVQVRPKAAQEESTVGGIPGRSSIRTFPGVSTSNLLGSERVLRSAVVSRLNFSV